MARKAVALHSVLFASPISVCNGFSIFSHPLIENNGVHSRQNLQQIGHFTQYAALDEELDVIPPTQQCLGSMDVERRKIVHSIFLFSPFCSWTRPRIAASAAASDRENEILDWEVDGWTDDKRGASQQEHQNLTIPLVWNGDAYVLYYRIDGDLFRAVVDTGSPFLMVSGSCADFAKYSWGCYRGEGVPSGLDKTLEQFDGRVGEVEWRMAKKFSFVNATGSMIGPAMLTFGVASDSLTASIGGGVFFGLVRDTDNWIRPSFLGQTPVRSFAIDLRSRLPSPLFPSEAEAASTMVSTTNFGGKTLTLSTTPLIAAGSDYIPLVTDLRRRFGDPTLHYTALADSIKVNGNVLSSSFSSTLDGRRPGRSIPIYAIFDTGVTGMEISQDLFNERYETARRNREKKMWGQVMVSFRTAMTGETVELLASSPLTTPLPNNPWGKRVKGYIVVLGLSFIDGMKLTVDIDRERLLIEGGH